MPEPLSPKSGLGMKVAVLPCRQATFFTMYLNQLRLSAHFTRVLKRKSISAWPAVATSWCCRSTSMPTSASTRHISVRMSCWLSSGATGK